MTTALIREFVLAANIPKQKPSILLMTYIMQQKIPVQKFNDASNATILKSSTTSTNLQNGSL